VIEDYAAIRRAPVRGHIGVTGLRVDDAGFVVSVPAGAIHAGHVVVANPFQRPCIPEVARDVASSVLQTDPTRYRRPEDPPDGAVLLVGSGASGCQIAHELPRAKGTVFLSVFTNRRVPRRSAAKTLIRGWSRWARFAQTIDSFPGRPWPRGSPSPGFPRPLPARRRDREPPSTFNRPTPPTIEEPAIAATPGSPLPRLSGRVNVRLLGVRHHHMGVAERGDLRVGGDRRAGRGEDDDDGNGVFGELEHDGLLD
jgi:hypothetical protein